SYFWHRCTLTVTFAKTSRRGILSAEAKTYKIPILTNFDPPPSAAIESLICSCAGITARSRRLIRQTSAAHEAVFGGEITALTERASDPRNEAMDRLEQHALQIGANAVLGFRFDSGELMQNTNEIIAYGTAVKLRRSV